MIIFSLSFLLKNENLRRWKSYSLLIMSSSISFISWESVNVEFINEKFVDENFSEDDEISMNEFIENELRVVLMSDLIVMMISCRSYSRMIFNSFMNCFPVVAM